MRGFTFSDSVLLAASVHALAFLISIPQPGHVVPPSPQVLHIKLGTHYGNNTDAAPSVKANIATIQALPDAVLAELVPSAAAEPVPSPTANTATAPSAPATPPAVQKPVAQVVSGQPASAIGSPLGNSTAANAGNPIRYEQLLALWLHKFKDYPLEARLKNEEGRAVIHIVINRSGTVLRSGLATRSGHPLLDEAALDMVRQAKSVPPVPADYPGGEELEFGIPVSFTLEGQ